MYPDSVSAYKYVKRKHHPLSPPCGKVPLHRLTLFDKIGPGTHPCYRCKTPVTWSTTSRTGKGVLVTDHVDGDPANNSPENLEPSCQSCNIEHGKDPRFTDGLFRIVGGKRQKADWTT